MIGICIMLIVGYATIFIHDRRKFRASSGRERAVYFALAAYSLYMSADCLMTAKLPALYSLIEAVFGPGARAIVRMLEVPVQ